MKKCKRCGFEYDTRDCPPCHIARIKVRKMEKAVAAGNVYPGRPSKYDDYFLKTGSAARIKAAKKKERSV